MTQISFDYSKAKDFFGEHELDYLAPYVELAHQQLTEKTGAGSDFVDWVDWPESYDKDEYERIKAAAEKIKNESEVLVVVGIGGSYLGAQAAIDFLSDSFYNYSKGQKGNPQVVFAGQNVSSTYMHDLLNFIGDRDFSVNMISKSGTTTEPGIAFRILKEKLVEKYGQEGANDRIYATTDQEKGALKSEANEAGYESFVIPDGIGGRFTVLTAVGLLPIAVAGGDIDQLMAGAREGMKNYSSSKLSENEAYQYAAIRNIFYRKGKDVEILVNYEPGLRNFAEWWKQLFAESEGKDSKGILPISANFTTDLHSVGQMIQDGKRTMFETVLNVESPRHNVTIPSNEENLDGLNYLAGESIDFVNKNAFQGTMLAHIDGGVPNLVVNIPKMDEFSLGQLIYFFERAVAISGYLNGVNPFDQPGVEAYKQNMFALLGKPGYEELQKELKSRL